MARPGQRPSYDIHYKWNLVIARGKATIPQEWTAGIGYFPKLQRSKFSFERNRDFIDQIIRNPYVCFLDEKYISQHREVYQDWIAKNKFMPKIEDVLQNASFSIDQMGTSLEDYCSEFGYVDEKGNILLRGKEVYDAMAEGARKWIGFLGLGLAKELTECGEGSWR